MDELARYVELEPFALGTVRRCGLPDAICYDQEAVLEYLTQTIGDADEALEHFEFNVIGGYVGPTTPFLLDRALAFESGRATPGPDGSGQDT